MQAPDFSQNFNRYSYALNNPLRFTDPNGEFAIIPIAIIVVTAFTTGYVAHGIATGNWGMSAVYSGALSALASGIAASTMGIGTVSGVLVFAGKDVANTILSNIIKPINIQLGDFGISLSPTAMLTAGIGNVALGDGFRIGAAISVSQRIGDLTLMANGSLLAGGPGKNLKNTLSGGFAYNDGKHGFSYMYNKYNYSKEPGGKQSTGTISARYKDFSLRWENDVNSTGGDGNDRFRSNATEIGYKNYFIGTNVFTNNPKDEDNFMNDFKGDKKYVGDDNGSNLFNNKYGTYNRGRKYSSPLYFGVKNGSQVARIGLNDPVFGDAAQNGFHHLPFVKSPNFHQGNYGTSAYFQKGTYSPYSLY